jgi:RNA polymerase sigma-70 factor (ECF subfamily)
MLASHSQSLKMGHNYLNSAREINMQLDPLSDNSLMLKVREGDLQKLGLLFERYKNILFGYFFKLSKDRAASEDLVQMVFMRVIKYKHAYRGDGSFKTWIFHIARNIQVDQWRKEKKSGLKVSTYHIEDRLASDKENNHQEEKLQLLERALDLLPDEKKELIVLSKLKGMKYKEIAQMMNLSEPIIKVRAFRALKELKEKCKEIEQTL